MPSLFNRNYSGNRPLYEKSCGRSRKISRHMAKGSSCVKYESKREIRRRSEKRDQETSTITRPNQNLDCFSRYQRQIHSDGKTEADRDGNFQLFVLEIRDSFC